jgi:hypothetical protein
MNIPEHYLIKDPTKLVKGQKLWSINFEEVEFKEFVHGYIYVLVGNISVEYSCDEKYNGKRAVLDFKPSLFLSNPFESQERVILVNKCGTLYERECIHESANGEVLYWEDKENLIAVKTMFWKELEPEEKELTDKERIDSLEQEVKNLKEKIKGYSTITIGNPCDINFTGNPIKF